MSSEAIYPLTPEQKYQLKLEYNRQHRAANREKYLAAKKKKRAEMDPELRKAQDRKWYEQQKEKRQANAREWYERNKDGLFTERSASVAKYMLKAARQRAKKQGIPCTITIADIVVPTHCPILGIPLAMATGTANDNSPSLDKIVPELGYVPGNVQVISNRANRIKYNATAVELRAIADYLEHLQSSATVPRT